MISFPVLIKDLEIDTCYLIIIVIYLWYKRYEYILHVDIPWYGKIFINISTFSLVRWWDVACSLFDTWLQILRGVLPKLLTSRISIIHRYIIQIQNKCKSFALFQVFRDSTSLFCITLAYEYRVLMHMQYIYIYIYIYIYSNTCGHFDMIEPVY